MTFAIPAAPTIMTLVVHGQPISVNAMYQHVQGRVVLSAAAEAWETTIRDQCMMWRRSNHAITFPRDLLVLCSFWGVRGDLDNYLKTTLDGLKVGIGVDDRHFRPIPDQVSGFERQGCIIRAWEDLDPRPLVDRRQFLSHEVRGVMQKLGITAARAQWLLAPRSERQANGPQ